MAEKEENLGKTKLDSGKRDHGGGVDGAAARYGGVRSEWIDLSTGINPHPFAFTLPAAHAWTALPDEAAWAALIAAARAFWQVPEGADILPVPGASAAIAQIPRLAPAGRVFIPQPTYNEHGASFAAQGWQIADTAQGTTARVLVSPNNPTGTYWSVSDIAAPLCVIDESFCDVDPSRSLVRQADRDGTLVLKSFGKFWGLAGLRLGFVIGPPAMIADLAEMLGPWPVAGPALDIGTQALTAPDWADAMRNRLDGDATRLDGLMVQAGARVVGGCALFRLYHVDDAKAWQDRLARHHIWSRIFPYSDTWLRLGLPPQDGWARLEAAL